MAGKPLRSNTQISKSISGFEMLMKLSSISNTKVFDSEGKLKAQKEFPSDATGKGNVKVANTSERPLERDWEFKFILVSDREKGK